MLVKLTRYGMTRGSARMEVDLIISSLPLITHEDKHPYCRESGRSGFD
jgi:hypothetical protein